jgi:hypothetical protein
MMRELTGSLRRRESRSYSGIRAQSLHMRTVTVGVLLGSWRPLMAVVVYWYEREGINGGVLVDLGEYLFGFLLFALGDHGCLCSLKVRG